MKNSREMRRLQKTSYMEDWTWQVGVELQDTMGVHSISTAFERGKDDGKFNADRLLEEILEGNNLRLAFKRVKANKGTEIKVQLIDHGKESFWVLHSINFTER